MPFGPNTANSAKQRRQRKPQIRRIGPAFNKGRQLPAVSCRPPLILPKSQTLQTGTADVELTLRESPGALIGSSERRHAARSSSARPSKGRLASRGSMSAVAVSIPRRGNTSIQSSPTVGFSIRPEIKTGTWTVPKRGCLGRGINTMFMRSSTNSTLPCPSITRVGVPITICWLRATPFSISITITAQSTFAFPDCRHETVRAWYSPFE